MMQMEITRGQWNIVREVLAEDNITDVRSDYSGRAMFGGKCIGVVGSGAQVAIRFMIAVAEQMSPDDLEDQKLTVIDMSDNMREDGMGLQMIYYFPDWHLVD